MGCYVLFALLLLAAPRRFTPIAVVLAILGALVVLAFAPRYMNTTYNFGVPRAAYGFLLGCLVQRIWSAAPDPGQGLVKWLEPVALIAAVAYVWLARGPWTVAAPLFFAVSIWIFSEERGLVSRLLSVRPMLALGHWSYSIYMVHMFVITVMLIIARKTDLMPDSRRIDLGSPWLNDLFALAVIGIIIGLSLLTYRFIEIPGRDAVNSWLAKRKSVKATRPVAPAAGEPV
jgi:peptidoglycan/LPS O-acetylase OafA/YrhL